jgi:hypothetical protein
MNIWCCFFVSVQCHGNRLKSVYRLTGLACLNQSLPGGILALEGVLFFLKKEPKTVALRGFPLVSYTDLFHSTTRRQLNRSTVTTRYIYYILELVPNVEIYIGLYKTLYISKL